LFQGLDRLHEQNQDPYETSRGRIFRAPVGGRKPKMSRRCWPLGKAASKAGRPLVVVLVLDISPVFCGMKVSLI
jgi:hypothetical protein